MGNEYFSKFDDDQNGLIEKSEMATFLKQILVTPKAKMRKELAKAKAKELTEDNKLSEFLGDYCHFFNRNIDDIWDQFDVDKNGMLDKNECKAFMNECKK